MELKELIKQKEMVMAELLKINEQMAQIESDIELKIAGPVMEARQLAAKDTGTINALVDGVMVKHQVNKRVVWDQSKMFEIWNRIKNAGDNPENYMTAKTSHSVKEKLYDSFPDPVRAIFSEAREVKAGTPKISFDVNWCV